MKPAVPPAWAAAGYAAWVLLAAPATVWASEAASEAAPPQPPWPDFVAVPGGTLTRIDGSTVVIAPFRLSRTEVTFEQYQHCVEAGACRAVDSDRGWGRATRPVIYVTFADAEAYVGWLSRHTGQPVRLPTEDEWEWAARGGTTTRYWWGDEIGAGHANCRHCGTPWSGKKTAPVASFAANPYGLYDMAGNVWEWVAGCADAEVAADTAAAGPSAGVPPLGTADGSCLMRIAKGGAWYYIPSQAEPTARAVQRGDLWSYTVGFRVAR